MRTGLKQAEKDPHPASASSQKFLRLFLAAPGHCLQDKLLSASRSPVQESFSYAQTLTSSDMESGPNRSAHACDCKNFRYNMSQAIYGSFPSCAADSTPSQGPRAKSPDTASKAHSKPEITVPVEITVCRQETTIDSINSDNTTPTWLPYQRISPGDVEKMDNIHQSVCLNLTAPCDKAGTTDSELWIMPELDDCESDSSSSASSIPSRSSSSSPPPARQYSISLSDATKAKAKFHLDQLRARLVQADYDAWDFFMARCNDEKKRNEALQALQHKHQSEERLDEEFDLVVLSAVPTSC